MPHATAMQSYNASHVLRLVDDHDAGREAAKAKPPFLPHDHPSSLHSQPGTHHQAYISSTAHSCTSISHLPPHDQSGGSRLSSSLSSSPAPFLSSTTKADPSGCLGDGVHPRYRSSSNSHLVPEAVLNGHAPKRKSFPFSLQLLVSGRSKVSSTSLAPSTAEGRPIPVDDSTAAHRTSALRQINHCYPSPLYRHRYTQNTGAKSSTYSQPVIVRTYSGPVHSQVSSRGRGRTQHHHTAYGSRAGGRRVPLPSSVNKHSVGGSGAGENRTDLVTINEFGTANGTSSNGHVSGMGRLSKSSRHEKRKPPLAALLNNLPWNWLGPSSSSSRQQDPDEPRLPPLEAFSFKSIMADLQSGNGGGDIGADLDRIAEICARSRYSVSNQYEVHVAPHGSGVGFTASGPGSSSPLPGRMKGNYHQRYQGHRSHGAGSGSGGPTLQVVSDDGGPSSSSHRKRRIGARRRSMAYGTLETIMSSSRSSEEDKSKKGKSAAEIAGEVRGRASRKNVAVEIADSQSPTKTTAKATTTTTPHTEASTQTQPEAACVLQRKRSAALMGRGRQQLGGTEGPAAAGASGSRLISGLAPPQTSTSVMEIRTMPGVADLSQAKLNDLQDTVSSPSMAPEIAQQALDVQEPTYEVVAVAAATAVTTNPASASALPPAGERLLSGLTSWAPWASPACVEEAGQALGKKGKASQAEGILRSLLTTAVAVSSKGKAVDQEG